MCTEYFLVAKKDLTVISRSLVVSLSPATNNICIGKFYPELNKTDNSKYLSAACFFLMTHHFSKLYGLDRDSKISLNTNKDVFNRFYGKLKDFNFHIFRNCLGGTVELISDFYPVKINTSMVGKQRFSGENHPFLV